MDTSGMSAGGDDAARGESQDGASQQDAANQADHSEESIRLAKELTPKQRIVLQALSEGCSPPEAARRAKVDPSTVNRWLNHNPRFIAAHNAWITETIKAGRAAVVSLIPLAAAAVREAIETGNGWLALQLLRDAKLTTLPEAGAITPKAAKKQIELEKQQRDTALLQKETQIKQQQHEIEKLTVQIEQYEERKRANADEDEHPSYFEAWAAFWSQWKSEADWQAQHALFRKQRIDNVLNEIQQQRERKRQEEEARQSGRPPLVWGSEWKPRLALQNQHEKEDLELVRAIKANPDRIAATGVKLPPGVAWPKGWPGAEKTTTDRDGSAPPGSPKREPGARDTAKSDGAGPSPETSKLQT